MVKKFSCLSLLWGLFWRIFVVVCTFGVMVVLESNPGIFLLIGAIVLIVVVIACDR